MGVACAVSLLRRAAREGVLLGSTGDRTQAVYRPPPPDLASELRASKNAVQPLLLPTLSRDWPLEWRELLDERIEIDRKVYNLTHEAAAFVSEAWFRLAHARIVANSPPPGEPWADLVLDDLLLATEKDHRTEEE